MQLLNEKEIYKKMVERKPSEEIRKYIERIHLKYQDPQEFDKRIMEGIGLYNTLYSTFAKGLGISQDELADLYPSYTPISEEMRKRIKHFVNYLNNYSYEDNS